MFALVAASTAGFEWVRAVVALTLVGMAERVEGELTGAMVEALRLLYRAERRTPPVPVVVQGPGRSRAGAAGEAFVLASTVSALVRRGLVANEPGRRLALTAEGRGVAARQYEEFVATERARLAEHGSAPRRGHLRPV